ncbi:MAG TPA: nucleotide exchange factor GrpE [Pirellulaceae bacterium]|nr:nucleotide exchange factor GrpE [Pirellulaceae bacterium]
MRTWWENEDILQRFRDWLSQTGEEVAALTGRESDSPSSSAAADLFNKPTWLDELDRFDEPDELNDEFENEDPRDDDPADDPAPELPAIGFIELIEAFTALRHETKLHTKSGRGLEDAVQSSLQGLNSAIRQFETVQSREEEAAARAAKPLAEALANLDEALARGAEAITASHRQAMQTVPLHLRDALDQRFQQLSKWRRWLSRPWHQQVQFACQEEISAAMGDTLHRAMEGYGLIQARLRRVMQEQGVARIECVGKPLDPAKMTVVELIDDPTAKPETVLEEVRPGYTYHGRVIRFAEVRATRSFETSV